MNARFGSWVVPLLAFLGGLLVGWLLLGWVIWPPPAKNAIPAALGANARLDYLALVADSFATNGNINVVRQRLQGFDLDQTARDIGELANRSEAVGLGPQAARLRNLGAAIARGDIGPVTTGAGAAGAVATAGASGAGAAAKAAATAIATAAPSGAASSSATSSSRIPTDWIIIAAFGLLTAALVVWAWQRWSLRRAATPSFPTSRAPYTAPPSSPAPSAGPPPASVVQPADGGPLYVSLNQPARISYLSDGSENADLRIFDAAAAGQTKTVIGQVDLRVAEILRPDPNELPAALELRLFDRRAARTVAAVLVSHDAYVDPTARQLVSTLPNNVVKPAFDVSRIGRVIVLETRNLRLQAEVVDVQFAPGLRYPAFDELVLEVTPMPNDTPPNVIDADYAVAEPDVVAGPPRVDVVADDAEANDDEAGNAPGNGHPSGPSAAS